MLFMQGNNDTESNSQKIRMYKDMLSEATASVNDNSRVKPFKHMTLEERAFEYGGKLNLDGEYDWGEHVGKENW